ncbi:PqiC family protein [Oceanospirillum sediminis]|uniref:Membrane integrity-associated transporter subunit PqiC n=1 Tax=Oceanospirillum sediminis TaxID=2760088 RepID=A0A839IR71_9GAMM|nr:ABC-type transport auxiliary lipoprotein family protein [Oceanospirillum sediminis]MBB1487785.1 membrane integrity-associated transporter subunit PqiC [Oceanospirillum sediminis]
MSHLISRCFAGIVVLLLTACATEPMPETHYYLLESNPSTVAKSDIRAVIGVSEVTAATYINNSGIAIRTGDNRIKLANYHLWAEQPDYAITRVLFSELNYRLPDFRVENSFNHRSSDWNYVISTQVDQFHGTEDGQAVLTGYWQLKDQHGVLSSHRFSLQTELELPGYDALIAALRQLLTRLAEQQVAEIRS